MKPARRLTLRGWMRLAALCGLFPALALALDTPPLILDHLTTTDGMPQGTVMASLQDSHGFVWLATEDGLVRYDGHDLVRYAYSRNAVNGLPGNFIFGIVEDAHGDLWLPTKDVGVARWNRATDRFTVYRHDAANPASLSSDATRALVIDAGGKVWIGMRGAGVDVLDPASGRIEHLHHDAADDASLISDDVHALMLDRRGTVWVGTADGLDQWQAEHRSFRHFQTKQVSSIFEDSHDSLWIGSLDAGLQRMDRGGKVLNIYRHDAKQPASLASDEVRAIIEDRAGHLWVGTADGLDLLSAGSDSFSHYRHDPGDEESLRDSLIMSLYQDGAGLIWIGTRAGGVSRWNPRSWELGGHRPAWLAGKLVTSFAEAPNNRVWIGSLGGGLVLFDPAGGEATPFEALHESKVMSLHTDRHHNLWIGTMTQGVKKLNTEGIVQSIPVKVHDAHATSAGGIMTIFESHRGEIWLGTHGGGANILDPVSGVIRQLPVDAKAPGAVSGADVSAIAEDAQGNIWLGTDGEGLDLARADGTVIKVFRNDPKDPGSIPSNTIFAIAADGAGQLWIATAQGGIARIEGSAANPDAIRFHTRSVEDGLSGDTIWALLNDGMGHLWLSGNAGLMRFNPTSGEIKTYHREHGLQGEEFDLNAYERLPDGKLCFGGPGGFNIFDPARLADNSHAPRVTLTRLEVLGVPVNTPTPVSQLNRIELDHSASIVSLDFAALDFVSPKRNQLAYRLSGLSDRWIDLGTQHRVTLTNLDVGDHILEVRAANADSVWSNPPLKLTLHRSAPPWRSAWAYSAYGLVILMILAYRIHLSREKLKRMALDKRLLEDEVSLRTGELRDTNRRLEEASQAKNNFLARMSHELRTPLNGVVGSSELLARTSQSAPQARLTETIRSSAKVLLKIVNDLLDLSKIQAGKLELEVLPFDVAAALEDCTTLLAPGAAGKGVDLIVSPPPQTVWLKGDQLRIRQIVMNLLGNAIKFTVHGEVVASADVEDAADGARLLHLEVSDTGIGMDAATIAKIFEPFTQADESTTRRFGGTGLGLAICHELVEHMGGRIEVKSKPNVGSTFHVCIPLHAAEAAPGQSSQPLDGTQVRLVTRRPALRGALERHAAALGITLTALADPESCDWQAPGIIIADWASCEPRLVQVLRSERAPLPPLLIVASDDAWNALRRACPDPHAIVVSPPIRREDLRAALTQALDQAWHAPLDAVVLTVAQPKPVAVAQSLTAVRGHVLLVEDEPVNMAVAQGYLAELGCTSIGANNGAEAVSRSATEKFDLIMMDLNMPDMDGFEATRLIRKGERAGAHVPIVAITAHQAASYRDACLTAGMDDILSKPYTFEECARLIARFLPPPVAQPAAAPTQDISSLTVVDAATVSGLRNLRGAGSSDLYGRLVELFQASSGANVQQLQNALSAGNTVAAAAVCHKFAAAAANVGAMAYAREIRRIEKLCAYADLNAAALAAGQLAQAHPALCAQLDALKLRASA